MGGGGVFQPPDWCAVSFPNPRSFVPQPAQFRSPTRAVSFPPRPMKTGHSQDSTKNLQHARHSPAAFWASGWPCSKTKNQKPNIAFLQLLLLKLSFFEQNLKNRFRERLPGRASRGGWGQGRNRDTDTCPQNPRAKRGHYRGTPTTLNTANTTACLARDRAARLEAR